MWVGGERQPLVRLGWRRVVKEGLELDAVDFDFDNSNYAFLFLSYVVIIWCSDNTYLP